jgi:hypothetical protein
MKTKQPRITPEREAEICELIVLLASRAKNGKVTWALLEKHTGFTRQALSAREAIAEVYQNINGSKKTIISAEKQVEDLTIRLEKALAENARLKKTLEEYDKKYDRWLYNATNANLTVEQLNTLVPNSMKTQGRKKAIK